MTDVLMDVLVERRRQDEKWGVQNHNPDRWLVIATEELGEASEADLKNDWSSYRTELVHLAAVAIAAIESLDRGVSTVKPGPYDDLLWEVCKG